MNRIAEQLQPHFTITRVTDTYILFRGQEEWPYKIEKEAHGLFTLYQIKSNRLTAVFRYQNVDDEAIRDWIIGETQ